ncbi:MAG: hypothetical protein GEV09_06660 [Pseudonocardiaceae bacterium]|nr:hypothetical protein [Pseudonocardiaceae bacterium]
MSKHLDAFADYMQNSWSRAETETDTRRRAILFNYNRHAALEFSDRWQEIFTPEMTNPHPKYKVRLGSDEVQVFDGVGEVKGFYGALNESVVWLEDEQLFVNDYGLASFSTFGQFIAGKDAAAAGYEVDDPEATYMLSCPLAMIWPYDENAKLIGEEVYELAPLQLSKPAPEDVFSFEERAEVLAKYL